MILNYEGLMLELAKIQELYAKEHHWDFGWLEHSQLYQKLNRLSSEATEAYQEERREAVAEKSFLFAGDKKI